MDLNNHIMWNLNMSQMYKKQLLTLDTTHRTLPVRAPCPTPPAAFARAVSRPPAPQA